MHGVFISSFWYFVFVFKAILPEEHGVNTLFLSPYHVPVEDFRGKLIGRDSFFTNEA